MNERIKELAFAATEGSNWKPGLGNPQIQEYMEKFAELIVRECVEICKKQEYKYWRSSEEDQWTPIDSANAIQEHFGVEE